MNWHFLLITCVQTSCLFSNFILNTCTRNAIEYNDKRKFKILSMNLYSTNLLILVNRKTKVSAVSLRAFGGKGSCRIPIVFTLFTGRESSFQSPAVRQTTIDTCPILQGRNKSYLIESMTNPY